MADLSDLQAATTAKLVGSDSSGLETNAVGADSSGNLQVIDAADGPVTPGTVASKSILTGMQYNTAAPAPTNGQQLAMQSTIDGRLKVDADISGDIVPTITNKFRIRLNTTNVTVPAAYTTLFSRTGTGLFFGFQASFNSAAIDIRLTIDSATVFEINLNDIKQFQFNDTGATRMQLGGFLTTVGNTLDFSCKFAIPYASNVAVDVRRSDGTNHTNTNWIVFLTEDT